MRRASRHRPKRLAALIQETIAEALATDLKDPRVGFVTVTSVTVSADGSHATVRVGVMGSEEEKSRAMEGLHSATGYLRTRLARTLSLRQTPELQIVLDRGLEHAARINEILERVQPDEPDS